MYFWGGGGMYVYIYIYTQRFPAWMVSPGPGSPRRVLLLRWEPTPATVPAPAAPVVESWPLPQRGAATQPVDFQAFKEELEFEIQLHRPFIFLVSIYMYINLYQSHQSI